MQAIKNRIIKWLGGYTRKEYIEACAKSFSVSSFSIDLKEIEAMHIMFSGGK